MSKLKYGNGSPLPSPAVTCKKVASCRRESDRVHLYTPVTASLCPPVQLQSIRLNPD
ncbi:hypothetical protein [Nostoc sp. 'Peltigera malacea cyanobiont' DB3992]|uniref:hypothetical protein n=1 Tax=Nostoc sp. 'Peltigera malacea cyanobiont' DB3992 TaxID=1206980 RepID=UPI0015D50778|nr:hypothetical protein [Nostoc sp. 'Peltigera malacea cyanobiont' DB3992]